MAIIQASCCSEPEKKDSLRPLGILLIYLLGATLLKGGLSKNFSVESLSADFMGGFFLLFSLFKMIDLKGFREAFASYDLLARRFPLYAAAYPFLELLLGLAYISRTAMGLASIVTVLVMAIGSLGVYQALRRGDAIQCACLGTALKLPMTKVTLLEDVTMGLMAAGMLFS